MPSWLARLLGRTTKPVSDPDHAATPPVAQAPKPPPPDPAPPPPDPSPPPPDPVAALQYPAPPGSPEHSLQREMLELLAEARNAQKGPGDHGGGWGPPLTSEEVCAFPLFTTREQALDYLDPAFGLDKDPALRLAYRQQLRELPEADRQRLFAADGMRAVRGMALRLARASLGYDRSWWRRLLGLFLTPTPPDDTKR